MNHRFLLKAPCNDQPTTAEPVGLSEDRHLHRRAIGVNLIVTWSQPDFAPQPIRKRHCSGAQALSPSAGIFLLNHAPGRSDGVYVQHSAEPAVWSASCRMFSEGVAWAVPERRVNIQMDLIAGTPTTKKDLLVPCCLPSDDSLHKEWLLGLPCGCWTMWLSPRLSGRFSSYTFTKSGHIRTLQILGI